MAWYIYISKASYLQQGDNTKLHDSNKCKYNKEKTNGVEIIFNI